MSLANKRIGVVILTLDAGATLEVLLRDINRQCCPLTVRMIIDSSSKDHTAALAEKAGFEVHTIERKNFNHGGTRQLAFELMQKRVEYIIYLTQDVQLTDSHCLHNLVLPMLADPQTAAVYGRQLPHAVASVEAALHRSFNYPEKSCKKTFQDRARLGIKAPFLSDSFAAYACESLDKVGGFPLQVPSCEDMYVGAKLLQRGYAVFYHAGAKVYHSHEYQLTENFRRYYAIGLFQGKEQWISQTFGKSEQQGWKILKYKARILHREAGNSAVCKMVWHMVISYVAFRLGKFRAK